MTVFFAKFDGVAFDPHMVWSCHIFVVICNISVLLVYTNIEYNNSDNINRKLTSSVCYLIISMITFDSINGKAFISMLDLRSQLKKVPPHNILKIQSQKVSKCKKKIQMH